MPRPAKPRFHPGNGCWCAQVGPKGPNGKSTVVYFPREIAEKDERGAWAYLDEYQRRQAAPAVDPASLRVVSLCGLYTRWAEAQAKAGVITAKEAKNKLTHVRLIAPHELPGGRGVLGDRLVMEVDVADVGGLVRAMAEREYSAHYIKNVCRTLVAMFRWAARPVEGREPTRLIPENPLRGWSPGVVTEKVERYAEDAAIRSFRRWAWGQARWAWLGPESRAKRWNAGLKPPPRIVRRVDSRFDRVFLLMARFIAMTGCRPKEACSARWADLRWSDATKKSGKLVLDRWKNRKKTGRTRTIFVTPPVARILRAIEAIPGRNREWIFTHRIGPRSPNYSEPGPHRMAGEPWADGTALGAKLRTLRARAIAAGVTGSDGRPIRDAGPKRLVGYLFRHTYISDALMKGRSSEEVAAITGTSREMIDRNYGHIQEEHSARIADELARRGKG